MNTNLVKNLKKLEKVMVWMLKLPVENSVQHAKDLAEKRKKVVCLNVWDYSNRFELSAVDFVRQLNDSALNKALGD